MLTRILIVVVLVGLALWLLRRALGRPHSGQPPPEAPAKPDSPPEEKVALDLVACRHCSLHLPRTEAIWRQGLPYCSEAHADEDSPA